MSEINESVSGDDDDKTTSAGSRREGDNSALHNNNHANNHENDISTRSIIEKDNNQELPELIRNTEGRRGLMSGMPSINLNELNVILRDPSMPSHKIMKEVADKIMLMSEESESDDGSVGSSGGVVGMKGLLDCIFEVTYQHTDSNNSDDEDDDSFERIPRELPCSFCNKVFGSNMTWKTHVLVAHQDPSVLNIRRLSNSEADRKEKNHPSHKKHTKGTSKSEAETRDNQACNMVVKDSKPATETSIENVAAGKSRSTVSKSQKIEPSSRYPSQQCKVEGESVSPGHVDAASCSSEGLTLDLTVLHKHKVVESSDQSVGTDAVQISEAIRREIDPADQGEIVESSTKLYSELLESEQVPDVDLSSQIGKDITGKLVEGSSIPSESPTNEIEIGEDAARGRKRRATSPLPQSISSTSSASSSSLSSKRSRKHVAKDTDSNS